MFGVILLAHGSRDPLWRAPIEALAQSVAQALRARPQPPQANAHAPSCEDSWVRCAYLELCEPGLEQAATELVALGVSAVRVVPIFFGMGKHAREDLPRLLEGLRQTHPNTRFECLPPVGEDPRLRALLTHLALEPLAGAPA